MSPASPAPSPADTARRLVRRPAVAAALLLAAALGIAMLALWARHGGLHAPTARHATRLADLPARPEDIEAHGAQARSILKPDDARARNAAVPFAAGPPSAARPFVFRGSDDDRARAVTCLATAALYEAGDDITGEAAVAQVVLNRVRHPAFPPTICGVVYQGAQRSTGCQFTFTCDGSLQRRQMPEAAWRRAREVAARAIDGRVDKTVGLATHYHTDWVYPYWSPALRKLAQVGTHLFFGWPGSWGGSYAFARIYRGNEGVAGPAAVAVLPDVPPPVDPDLGGPRILGLPQPRATLPAGMGNVPLYGSKLRLARPDGRAFGLLAPPGASAAKLIDAARALCERPGACQVMAWANEDDIPDAYPVPVASRGTIVFEYVRDAAGGAGTIRLDCDRFPGGDAKRCLPGAKAMPAELSGIRWKE